MERERWREIGRNEEKRDGVGDRDREMRERWRERER